MVNRRGAVSKPEAIEIKKRTKVYFVVTLISLILISFFNPITNRFTNSEYDDLIKNYKDNIKDYSESYDYKKAALNSYLLNEIVKNSESKYLASKYTLLTYLMNRPRTGMFQFSVI